MEPNDNPEVQAEAGGPPAPDPRGPSGGVREPRPGDKTTQADFLLGASPSDADDRTIVQPGLAGIELAVAGAPPSERSSDRTEAQPVVEVTRAATVADQAPAAPEGKTEAAPGPAGFDEAGGPQVPGYRVLAPLGEGTYGAVWLAENLRTGVRVAIKFFARGTTLEWQLVQAEVKQLARLHADPGIVQLINVELAATPPYYVMAYAEKGSLARRLEKGPLPVEEALEVIRQLAEALAYVHAKGIRHCDLKPGNVLLNARGRALLGDFGQAHLCSDVSPALGTFFYMAPEQADLTEQIPDTRWDVYGLGAILYAMLTGRPPHEDPRMRDELGKTVELAHRLERYRAWVQKAPRPTAHRRVPGIDRQLVEIIDRCLEVDPNRRLRDAGTVLAALARRERQRRQRPLLVFGFVAQVVLFLVMAGIASWAFETGTARTEAALTDQLLRSDRVNASVIAGGLEQEMTDRLRVLERHADSAELRRATAQKDEAALRRLMDDFDRQHGRKTLAWIIADAQGFPLARHLNVTLPAKMHLPTRFAWRDWFNGRGDHPENPDGDYPPIRATHVSEPFLARATGDLVIGLSTPVLAPGSKTDVVGVLYAPVRLQDVDRWLDRVKTGHGFAILVDRRGHVLRHRDPELVEPRPGQVAKSWQSAVYAAAVREEGSTASYVDPVDGRTYLAGYAPLPALGWGALVQQEREAALKPVADLKEQMIFLGAVMLVTVSLVVSILWGWLIWSLRRKDRPVNA